MVAKRYFKMFHKKALLLPFLFLFMVASGCSASGSDGASGNAKGKSTSGSDVGASAIVKKGDQEGCAPTQGASAYFGTYVVDSATKYRGGLTTESKAKSEVGKQVVLGKDAFKSSWDGVTIAHPIYAVSCHSIDRPEGEVAPLVWGAHWTSWYGYGPDREVVRVLEIRKPENKAEKVPDYWYEIVTTDGTTQLWYQFDGFIYKLDKR